MKTIHLSRDAFQISINRWFKAGCLRILTFPYSEIKKPATFVAGFFISK